MRLNEIKKYLKFVFLTSFILLGLMYINSSNSFGLIADLLRYPQKTMAHINWFTSNVSSNIQLFFFTFSENKRLREENFLLHKYKYLNQILIQENISLKKSLFFMDKINLEFVSANVIARTNGANSQRMVIDLGKNNEIKKGQLVMFNQQLIGRVIETSDNSSIVLLIIDDLSSIPVQTVKGNNKCIASGFDRFKIICKYMDEFAEVEPGDLVVTSNDSDEIMPNLLVGTINKKDDQYFISPIYDFNKLQYVQIIK